MKKVRKFFRENKRLTHLISLLIMSVVGASTFSFIHNSRQKVSLITDAPKVFKKPNLIDLHLSQYSDKHITINAIDSNEKFSHLSLADYIKQDLTENKRLIPQASQVANVIGARHKNTPEYGTWIWTPLMDMTKDYIDSIVKGAKTNGLNTIYVSIDTYLDIYVMPESNEKNKKIKAFSDKLEEFIISANKSGIVVDAEAGWRNWAELGNQYKAFAIINFVKEFNSTHAHTLRGFQYDVEPYMLGSYANDKISILKNFLDLISDTVTLLGNTDLTFSVVIPDFYDKTVQLTPEFEYNGKTSFTYNHLLDVLQSRPDSKIIIMSYRNFAHGQDGSIDISTDEVETATNGMYSTKIIIAQETGDVPPPYITFHNTTKNYYSQQIEEINKAFGYYENFGGIAVHYVNAYLDLK